MDSVKEFKELIKENKKLLYKISQTGQIEIRFEDVYELNELLVLIKELLNLINGTNIINNNLNFNFIVNDEEEEKTIKRTIEVLNQNNINCSITYSDKYQKDNPVQQNTQELIAKIAEEIIKYGPNGEIRRYIEFENNLYEDNFKPSISDDFKNYLKNIQNSPENINIISNMTQIEFENQCKNIMKYILQNRKAYPLENSKNNTIEEENNHRENITNELIATYDGKGNLELGIIKKGADRTVSQENHTVVEEKNNGEIKIVTPTINENTITSNGDSGNITTQNGINNSPIDPDNQNNNEMPIENVEINPREIPKGEIYIEGNIIKIYNKETEQDIIIGELGKDGYEYDKENNILLQNEKELGQVTSITKNKARSLQKNNSNNRSTPNGYINFFLFSIIVSLALVLYMLVILL